MDRQAEEFKLVKEIYMEIFNSLDEIENIEPCIVALGNFDGVHLGHQEIIKKAVNDAQNEGMRSAIFTFTNHPRNLINEDLTVKNILYVEDKRNIIESLGIDYYVGVKFDDNIKNTSPVEFIEDILLKKLNIKGAM